VRLARAVVKEAENNFEFTFFKPTAGQRRWAFCFHRIGSLQPTPHRAMITENPTRPTGTPLRRIRTPLRASRTPLSNAEAPLSGDPVGLLIRAYRQAGLSIEAARRCAVADFECNFPQLLGT
jgi:hypothetical protein